MNRRDLFRSALGAALAPLALRLPAAAEAAPLHHFSGLVVKSGTHTIIYRGNLCRPAPRPGPEYSWDDGDNVSASAWVGDGGPAV